MEPTLFIHTQQEKSIDDQVAFVIRRVADLTETQGRFVFRERQFSRTDEDA